MMIYIHSHIILFCQSLKANNWWIRDILCTTRTLVCKMLKAYSYVLKKIFVCLPLLWWMHEIVFMHMHTYTYIYILLVIPLLTVSVNVMTLPGTKKLNKNRLFCPRLIDRYLKFMKKPGWIRSHLYSRKSESWKVLCRKCTCISKTPPLVICKYLSH